MVKTIPVRDLRNEYGRILQEVAGGETFTVTNHGTPVATITPYVDPTATGPREGVPVADLAALMGTLTAGQAAHLEADLAGADWNADDPWERRARLAGAADGDDDAEPRTPVSGGEPASTEAVEELGLLSEHTDVSGDR